MATRIELRTDTEANWISVNPVLSLGEVGIATDQNAIKLGDGTTNWNDLPYLPGAGAGGGLSGPILDGIEAINAPSSGSLALTGDDGEYTGLTITPNNVEAERLTVGAYQHNWFDVGPTAVVFGFNFANHDVVKFLLQGDVGFGEASGLFSGNGLEPNGRYVTIIIDRGEGTGPGDQILDQSLNDQTTNFFIEDPDNLLNMPKRYTSIRALVWDDKLIGRTEFSWD